MSDGQSGRISDDPEGFIVTWLRNRAQDIEDGNWSLERLSQSFPPGEELSLFEFTVVLRALVHTPPPHHEAAP